MCKNDLPLLSVIVPIYGVEKYLNQCIRSISEQTYHNLEIVLVDDGSTGNEGKICDDWAAKDLRIKVIHKTNEGLVEARKTGITAASSDYITFVDGDDYIEADYYEKLMANMISENADLVCASFMQYYSDDRKEVIIQNMPSGVYAGKDIIFLHQNMNCYKANYYDFAVFPSTCLKLYRKSILLQDCMSIPAEITLGEDSAVTFPYLLRCNKVVVDNSITGYYYRYLEDSMTKVVDIKMFDRADCLYRYLKPFYDKTCDEKTTIQLELFRLYLVNTILAKNMANVSLLEVHGTCKRIKTYVSSSELFDIEDDVIERLSLPEDLMTKMKYIAKSDWRGFELLWIRKLAWSYLYTMARKVLRRP